MSSLDRPMSARVAEPREPADEAPGANGLMARLGRLLERDRLADTEILALFGARATDVRANKLAAAWCAAYQQGDGARRRALLSGLVRAHARFNPAGEEAARLFKRLNAQQEGLRFLVDLRADMLRWRKQVAGLQAWSRCWRDCCRPGSTWGCWSCVR